jgi:hypothetical protein
VVNISISDKKYSTCRERVRLYLVFSWKRVCVSTVLPDTTAHPQTQYCKYLGRAVRNVISRLGEN